MIHVLYHGACTDGFAAAWVVYDHFRHQGVAEEVKLYPMAHGDAPPYEAIQPEHQCFIVDFSFSRHDLLRLEASGAHCQLYDHHTTAQADLEGIEWCVFDMAQSGAGLTWRQLHPGQEVPTVIQYVEDRDLWRFDLEYSREISAYLLTIPHTIEAWDELMRLEICPGGEVQHSELYGRAMGAYAYLQHYVGSTVQLTRWYQVEGHDVPVVNVANTGVSDVLNRLCQIYPDAPFALGWYEGADGRYHYSLRSRDDFDVSELARIYRGGGHAQASGFRLARQPRDQWAEVPQENIPQPKRIEHASGSWRLSSSRTPTARGSRSGQWDRP